MIITRTPFRVSLFGGGTDLPSFYRENGGCVLSMAINKYMYIVLHPTFDGKTIVKYNKTEIVDDIHNIQHPIARQLLLNYGINGIEITSMADVLSGTGLSTSSAYTVGLINALYNYTGNQFSRKNVAAEACEVEINQLNEPIGKQDQYGTAIGGLKHIEFFQNEQVLIDPIFLRNDEEIFIKHFVLFYTGLTHSSKEILIEQNKNDNINQLFQIKEIVYDAYDAIDNRNFDQIGYLLNKSWQLKKQLASKITNSLIDKYYQIAIDNGALGGKLLGAGGGGFLLFYCPPEKQNQLRAAIDLKELPFSIDHEGTKLIYKGDV